MEFSRFRISIGDVDCALNDLNRAIQLNPSDHKFLETTLSNRYFTETIVEVRINETLQTGAVGNRTYRGQKCLFIFRIHHNIK